MTSKNWNDNRELACYLLTPLEQNILPQLARKRYHQPRHVRRRQQPRPEQSLPLLNLSFQPRQNPPRRADARLQARAEVRRRRVQRQPRPVDQQDEMLVEN